MSTKRLADMKTVAEIQDALDDEAFSDLHPKIDEHFKVESPYGITKRRKILELVEGKNRQDFLWVKEYDLPLWCAIDGLNSEHVQFEGLFLLTLYRNPCTDEEKGWEHMRAIKKACMDVILKEIGYYLEDYEPEKAEVKIIDGFERDDDFDFNVIAPAAKSDSNINPDFDFEFNDTEREA